MLGWEEQVFIFVFYRLCSSKSTDISNVGAVPYIQWNEDHHHF